jgi:hypothetical protein
MADFHVTGVPRVNIRCQFEHIPGVTHITMEMDPYSRGNQICGKVKLYGGIGGNEFTFGDDEVTGCLIGNQEGTLSLFEDKVFKELSEAIMAGMKKLGLMAKAGGYVPNPF